MRKTATAELIFAALMCALCCVLSQVQFPLPPVPVSLALLAVHLCGTLLPARLSAAALGAYVLLGAAGLPVFAGFLGGPSALFGPTGGYLFGYILCAVLEGRLLERLPFTRRTLFLSMALGTLACYTLGTVWFMALTGTKWWASLTMCVFPFIPGDALKIILAVSVSMRLRKALRPGVHYA